MWRVPWHRVRGSEGQPRSQTLVSHNISPRRGTEAWNQVGYTDNEEGEDDDKRSRRARLDRTSGLSRLTTIPFQRTTGNEEIHGAKRPSKLPLAEKSERVSLPISVRHHGVLLGMSLGSNQRQRMDRMRLVQKATLVDRRGILREKQVFLRIVRIRV